jgi:hypothetical protein
MWRFQASGSRLKKTAMSKIFVKDRVPRQYDSAIISRLFSEVEQQVNTLDGSATYDPPSMADGVGATTTVTVTGVVPGDYAIASFSLDLQGITLTAWVSSANTVSVRFQNESGGLLDLSSGTLRVRVSRM